MTDALPGARLTRHRERIGLVERRGAARGRDPVLVAVPRRAPRHATGEDSPARGSWSGAPSSFHSFKSPTTATREA